MADRKVNNSIEIERGVIEQYLMSIRDYIRNNNTLMRKGVIGLLVLVAASVAAFVYIDHKTGSDFHRYEAIIDSYRMNPQDKGVREKTIADLKEFSDSTMFGHAHQMSFYMLGNLLCDDGSYAEAYEMFMKFIKKSSSDEIFIPIAVSKASLCLEEQGKVDEAISMLQKFEDKTNDSIVLDRILYDTGRLFGIKGDIIKAKEYYNKVLSVYPDSVFAERARERLFIIGASK